MFTEEQIQDGIDMVVNLISNNEEGLNKVIDVMLLPYEKTMRMYINLGLTPQEAAKHIFDMCKVQADMLHDMCAILAAQKK